MHSALAPPLPLKPAQLLPDRAGMLGMSQSIARFAGVLISPPCAGRGGKLIPSTAGAMQALTQNISTSKHRAATRRPDGAPAQGDGIVPIPRAWPAPRRLAVPLRCQQGACRFT